MVIKLALMRHAKSAWDDAEITDKDRPLNERGRRDAPVIAEFLTSADYSPMTVLCSSAVRTRETLERMLDRFQSTPEIHFLDDLYLASPSDMADLISDAVTNARPSPILILGHNPGMHDLAIRLSDIEKSDEAALRKMAAKFPTAAVALYALETEHMKKPFRAVAALTDFRTPKMLAH